MMENPLLEAAFKLPNDQSLHNQINNLFLPVYDILTGKMVNGGIEGHKDIVRDVAWHPKRNEILTSSVSYFSPFHNFQSI